MRRFLLGLLILLTALRGFAGDAMAMQMAMGHNGPAAALEAAGSALPCHETMEAKAVGSTGDDAAQTQQSCTTCQVCHLSATLPATPLQALAPVAVSPLAVAVAGWRSATLPIAIKPPIS